MSDTHNQLEAVIADMLRQRWDSDVMDEVRVEREASEVARAVLDRLGIEPCEEAAFQLCTGPLVSLYRIRALEGTDK